MSKIILFFAVLWLLFAVVHEFATGKLWFWVLPGMAPPILFAFFPAAFLLSSLLLKRYRLPVAGAALAAFAVSSSSTGINYAALDHRAVASDLRSSVHVVQMNTDYWGQERDGTLTDPRNKDEMLAFMRALDADVYLIQEFMLRDGDYAIPITDFSDLDEWFPEYEAVSAGTLLTLSRLPVVAHAVVNPDTSSTLDLPPPPYSLRVDVAVGEETLSTYNIHMPVQIIIELNWFGAQFYDEIRERHTIRREEYEILEADVLANPNPLVIAGDLNTSPAMGDNRRLLAITQDAARYSSILYPATWRVGGQLPKAWRNDWFLFRNDLRVDSFRSLDPEGNSDHMVHSLHLTLTGR